MSRPPLTAALLLTLSLLLLATTTTNAFNITRILQKHPAFSTFNHYLTLTHLAAEINRRDTITILALDNGAMGDLLNKGYSIYTLRNILSLHVLTDYFGAKKLHQLTDGTTLTASMFQATGSAVGTSGYVNITDLKGGKVGFGSQDNDGKLDAKFVKSLEEFPYDISILMIDQPLTSVEAEAPTAAPSLNLTTVMAKQGCQAFLDLLKETGALTTFEQAVEGGLTVFCPTDTVLKGFMPKYKNLTAPQKSSLLLYHGFPVYMSLQMLKTSNGVMNTLATDGPKKFHITIQDDGEDVKLETKVVTATITGTVKDEEPLIVYTVDKVLQPKEFFKGAPEPEEAPAPKPAKKKKSTKKGEAPADDDTSDAPAPMDDYVDDSTAADDNGVGKMDVGRFIMVILSICVGVVIF